MQLSNNTYLALSFIIVGAVLFIPHIILLASLIPEVK